MSFSALVAFAMLVLVNVRVISAFTSASSLSSSLYRVGLSTFGSETYMKRISKHLIPAHSRRAFPTKGMLTQMVATNMATDDYAKPVKVAYQGESGAYSEKAARELLGPRITTVAYESFEATFKAVASKSK